MIAAHLRHAPPPPSTRETHDYGRWWSSYWQVWWTRAGGAPAIGAAQRDRLAMLVAHARTHSPLYRDAYRELPLSPPIDALPVMTKHALMADFDRWVTDPAIRYAELDAFLADRSHIGERYLGRYLIWKSSGSTGEPGVYVQDDRALSVYDALVAVQLSSLALAGDCVAGLFGGGRAALVAATGDHFASIASWERACRAAPGMAARGFSIMEPLSQLVAALNAYRPAYLASYPTMLTLLAEEREAGRLRIAPSIVWSGGEFLAPGAQAELARAFGCPVLNEYGTSECMSIAVSCPEGWLHVNADWVLLEPVDTDHRPTPPGEASHTVLLTNLANLVQPIIRYDLGDTVVARPSRCPCGSPMPAIRVEGRREDVLTMPAADARPVRLLPLALTTLVEEATGCHRFQIVQTADHALALRFDAGDERARRDAFHRAEVVLRRHLAHHDIAHARIALAAEPPLPDRRSGKLRQVVLEPAPPCSGSPRSHAAPRA
jgi:phenylacetate-coenzyme A ligase PaaK-like adenylate-forming protein